MNQRDMFDLFTTVFLLSIDHETQLRRLDTADNADRNAAQRAQILDGRATFEREMRAAERWSSTGVSRQVTWRVAFRTR